MKIEKNIPIPPANGDESCDIGGEFTDLEQTLRAALHDNSQPILNDDRQEIIHAAFQKRFRPSSRSFRRVAEWTMAFLILAILAGMMLPALSQSREKAREISRRSEQKQKALADMMEADMATVIPVETIVVEAKRGYSDQTLSPSPNASSPPPAAARPMIQAVYKPAAIPPPVAAKSTGKIMSKLSNAAKEDKEFSRNDGLSEKSEVLPVPEVGHYRVAGGGLTMKSSRDDAFSTFAIDTDNAGYIMARDAIRNHLRPAPASIRAEEFINYFDYNYPKPGGEELFRISSEVMRNPFRPDSRNLAIGIQGKTIGIAPGTVSRYHVVVDASGSMALGNRWLPALETLEQLKSKLQARDQIQVVYSHDGDKMPGGRGDLTGNILTMGEALIAGEVAGQNHLIIITDGDDVPDTDGKEKLRALAGRLRNHRMALTVFGFGALRDAPFWEKLAEEGGGSLVYADQPEEVTRLLSEEFEARFRPIAEDVKIQVEFNPAAARSFRLIGYDERAMDAIDFRNDNRRASPVGSGQAVTAVYEWLPALGIRPESVIATLRVRYRRLDDGTFDEKEFLITAEQAERNFEDAPALSQLAVLAGEFAESLKYPETGGVAQVSGILARLPALSGKNQELRELLQLLK